jgi:hypothetical protein
MPAGSGSEKSQENIPLYSVTSGALKFGLMAITPKNGAFLAPEWTVVEETFKPLPSF